MHRKGIRGVVIVAHVVVVVVHVVIVAHVAVVVVNVVIVSVVVVVFVSVNVVPAGYDPRIF